MRECVCVCTGSREHLVTPPARAWELYISKPRSGHPEKLQRDRRSVRGGWGAQIMDKKGECVCETEGETCFRGSVEFSFYSD